MVLLILIVCFIFFWTAYKKENIDETVEYDPINNLESFAKLYGYVQYFHPSDEASQINWEQFAIYGSPKKLKGPSL